MSKGIWKWIISEMSDENIVHLVISLNDLIEDKKKITIQGVSDIKNLKPEQTKIFRNRIEIELLKPRQLMMLKKWFQLQNKKIVEKEETLELLNLIDMDSSAIFEIISKSEKWSWSDILIYLMSSTSQDQNDKGEALFNMFINSEEFNRNKKKSSQQQEEINKEQEKIGNAVRIRTQDLEVKVSQLESVKEKLEEQLSKYKLENKETKKLSNKQTERFEIEIKELKKIISSYEQQKQKYENELQNKEEEILGLKTINEKYKTDNDRLQNKFIALKDETQFKSKEIEKLREKIKNDAQVQTLKKQVILLEKNMSESLQSNNFNITIKNPRDINGIIENEKLSHIDEIWLLKFRIPILKRNELKRTYGQKVIEFDSYDSLKLYATQ